MDFLTAEQKASFEVTNKLLGLGPQEHTAHLSDEELAALPADRIMSHDPEESHFPPHHIAVGSIAELRKLAGFPADHDGSDDNHIDYPDPPNDEEIKAVGGGYQSLDEMDDHLHYRIKKAAQAFVMGDPGKVKAFEPLINASMFPGQVAVFAAPILDVPANSTHVIKGDGHGPVILNYGKIVVGKNASISVETNVTVNTQLFIQL